MVDEHTKRIHKEMIDANPKKYKKEGEFGFVECDLSADDKRQIVAYIEAGELAAELVDELVADGYQYGCKGDGKSSGYMATLIDRMPTSPFAGKCLVGRGSSPASARSALLYKHIYKMQRDWTNGAGGGDVDFG